MECKGTFFFFKAQEETIINENFHLQILKYSCFHDLGYVLLSFHNHLIYLYLCDKCDHLVRQKLLQQQIKIIKCSFQMIHYKCFYDLCFIIMPLNFKRNFLLKFIKTYSSQGYSFVCFFHWRIMNVYSIQIHYLSFHCFFLFQLSIILINSNQFREWKQAFYNVINIHW